MFYKWLWRHVFCVKLLRAKFPDDGEKRDGFFNRVVSMLPKSRQQEAATRYLKQYGDSFWQETETIIKEATRTVETSLQGAVGGNIAGVASLGGAAARKLTDEQRAEVINRGREVVSRVQIRELDNLIQMLDDLLYSNRQQRYYITIDRLDENWAEDRVRMHLIKALLQASLDFASVKNAKIIIALRSDLIDRVYRLTRSSGFQEEKFRTSTIDLTWSKGRLTEVLDSRIGVLVKEKYTNATVTHADLLPPSMGKNRKKEVSGLDYMVERTLCRPRDIIQFFNTCIKHSDGKPTITVQALLQAEGQYSRDRFRALMDEWFSTYPNLSLFAQALKNKLESFRVGDISLDEISNMCLIIATCEDAVEGLDIDVARQAAEGQLEPERYRRWLIQTLYKVGMVGLRAEISMPISWSFEGGLSVSDAEITVETRVYVQPTFWRCFGITDRATLAA